MGRGFVCTSGVELKKGTPIASRVGAFRDYFERARLDYNKGSFYVFCTMPPFRGFSCFFKLNTKIVLDIRDGWSIAQATGYGGNVRKKPFKALIARAIERFIIRRSFVAITCTPGLVKHLEKVSGKQIILIPNGISDERLQLIGALKTESIAFPEEGEVLRFVCAGQFSEYGKDKAKKLLDTISERYSDKRLLVELIGSNPDKNSWAIKYFSEITAGRGHLDILSRMNEEKLFKQMLKADFGLTIIRDPFYELGTKIYDYIALGLPVVNYFDEPNNFTDYFDACLDVPFGRNSKIPEIRRSVLIEQGLKDVDF